MLYNSGGGALLKIEKKIIKKYHIIVEYVLDLVQLHAKNNHAEFVVRFRLKRG